MTRRKTCRKCKQMLDPSKFNRDRAKKDGLCAWCRECHKLSEEYNSGPRKEKTSKIVTYRVIYDPCDSFSVCSEFTRAEVYEMLKADYLAIGTTFFRKRDKTYHQVTTGMHFELVNEYARVAV